MNFKKLALASAIAMVPTVGFSAMVEIEDTALSDMTGQDGIEIDIVTSSAITGNVYIHDTDGLTSGSTAYSFDGAIVIENFSFNGNMNIDIDAGDSANANTAPTLQVNVSFPAAVTIVTGNIRVANSQRDDVASGWAVGSMSGVILNTMTIVMSGLALNIQLGNEPQGDMIAISSTITNGLSINNFALNDAGGSVTGGSIGAANILIKDNGSANLTLGNVRANATNVGAGGGGLVIDLVSVGSGGIDLRITDAYLGTTGAGIIGDITVVGLNVNGTRVTISGK